MKAGYTSIGNKIEKKISKKNEGNSNIKKFFFFQKKNGKNKFYGERFKLKINKKKEKNTSNLNAQNNTNNLQGIIDKSKSANTDEINEDNHLEEKSKINNEKKIKSIKINFNNHIKKSVSSKFYFEGDNNKLPKLSNNYSFKKTELFPKNKIELSMKNIKEISDSLKSENIYESDSYGKFFEINNEAKRELSEHVKTLIISKNDSNIDFKTKEIFSDDEESEYQNFNKLKTLYESAHATTRFFLTKIINSKEYIERNIPLYDDILNKNSESLFKKLDIFDEDEKVDNCEQGYDIVDSICEYFTYLMSLTLIK
ncbi:conserved Plasmodium protein, unknown function [Plasmodium gallinaceum]|uniref:Uncharacterized protein n=1 Tax=Plasmodium gallinaceum TaxID=5849 RepID=A0A1J1GS18_PLAGA|nr:conserved Plasmodium protein, unknown function [Plasmodium gallinaceum]CRG93835.1 conserved Plasmodium protein, unknown function [Plasmodium gallinaceum]